MHRDLRLRPNAYPLIAGLAIVLAIGLAAFALANCAGAASAKGAAPARTAAAPPSTTRPRNLDGPFAIGQRTITFVDTTRRTPANGSVPGRPTRTLQTVIDYPIAGVPSLESVKVGARPAKGLFPMVVYADGFAGGFESPYLRYWAAAGFVAVAPTFPLTRQDAPGGPSYVDTFNEPADVSFVISQMLHLPAGQADLQRVIDPKNIGLMGASLGATVALDVGYNSLHQDPRVKAVVSVAGGCAGCPPGVDPNGKFFTGPSRPLMLVHGTADPFAPYQQSVQEYAVAPSPKFFVTLIGAKHIRYDQPWETIAARSMIDFFDLYLKNEKGGLTRLRVDATRPGKARLQQALPA